MLQDVAGKKTAQVLPMANFTGPSRAQSTWAKCSSPAPQALLLNPEISRSPKFDGTPNPKAQSPKPQTRKRKALKSLNPKALNPNPQTRTAQSHSSQVRSSSLPPSAAGRMRQSLPACDGRVLSRGFRGSGFRVEGVWGYRV